MLSTMHGPPRFLKTPPRFPKIPQDSPFRPLRGRLRRPGPPAPPCVLLFSFSPSPPPGRGPPTPQHSPRHQFSSAQGASYTSLLLKKRVGVYEARTSFVLLPVPTRQLYSVSDQCERAPPPRSGQRGPALAASSWQRSVRELKREPCRTYPIGSETFRYVFSDLTLLGLQLLNY